MRSSYIIQLSALAIIRVLGVLVTGELGNATVVTNNPIGKEAVAILPDEAFFKAGNLNGNVKGSIKVKSGNGGIGVDYTVKFENIPKEGGPFIYHIHDKKVPDDGNCTATAAHLDPTTRGESPSCDSNFPQTCQVGDLSGKYGNVTKDPFEVTFHDEFGSLNSGTNASIIDRSFVFHFGNKTRISCANFVVSSDSNGNSGANSTVTASASSTGTTKPSATSTSPVTVTGAANRLKQQFLVAALFAGLVFIL